MGRTFSEEDWEAWIKLLETSTIPDHAKGLLELIKVLKAEIASITRPPGLKEKIVEIMDDLMEVKGKFETTFCCGLPEHHPICQDLTSLYRKLQK